MLDDERASSDARPALYMPTEAMQIFSPLDCNALNLSGGIAEPLHDGLAHPVLVVLAQVVRVLQRGVGEREACGSPARG